MSLIAQVISITESATLGHRMDESPPILDDRIPSREEPGVWRDVCACGPIEPIYGQLVSGNYFTLLGVGAAGGRVLDEEDNRSLAGGPVAVLSHSAWTRRFGRHQQVVSRTLNVNGTVLTIVGVAQAGFYGASLGESTGIWLPLVMQHEVGYASNVAAHNGDTSKPWPPQENLYWLQALVRVTPPASQSASQQPFA